MASRSREAITNLAILFCVSPDKQEGISGVHTETRPGLHPPAATRTLISPTLDKPNCLHTLLNATWGQNRLVENPGGNVVSRWLENTEFPSTAGGLISAPCFFPQASSDLSWWQNEGLSPGSWTLDLELPAFIFTVIFPSSLPIFSPPFLSFYFSFLSFCLYRLYPGL